MGSGSSIEIATFILLVRRRAKGTAACRVAVGEHKGLAAGADHFGTQPAHAT